MKVKEMITLIEDAYDISLAPEWDNNGLQVGSYNDEVSRILVALEITDEVIDEAITGGYNAIITHHPLIFGGAKNINDIDNNTRMTFRLIRNKITVYSIHTPLDIMEGGTTDHLCRTIGLINISKLSSDSTDSNINTGAVRVGDLSSPMELNDFANLLKKNLLLSDLRISSSGNQIKKTEMQHSSLLSERLGGVSKDRTLDLSLGKKVQRIAVCAGSGMSLFDEIMNNDNIDAYVTGDVKHHDYRKAEKFRKIIVDIGHYDSESFYLSVFVKNLSRLFSGKNVIITESSIIEKPYITL